MLGPEDIFELEHGTALDELGQRVALRQVLQAAWAAGGRACRATASGPRPAGRKCPRASSTRTPIPSAGLPRCPPAAPSRACCTRSWPTWKTDERPDLFDIKFLRDELLYYARDENQFLRRRRTFVFALFPDLVQARFKDAELPWQRIVLLLAMLAALVRKLSEWLSTDALTFEFLFLTEALLPERKLLETVFREQIANHTVILQQAEARAVAEHCEAHARRSLRPLC